MRSAIRRPNWLYFVAAACAACLIQLAPSSARGDGNAKIEVVAAENFYGDLANQLGGDHVHVVSIMSDPNVDPHEYEADPKDAIAVARANIVIQNGSDYDNWMPQLLGASPNPSRVVLTGADLSRDLLKENPHVWYSLKNIQDIATAITKSYESLDAADAPEFEHNLKTFDDSLRPVEDEMESIHHDFNGTPVGIPACHRRGKRSSRPEHRHGQSAGHQPSDQSVDLQRPDNHADHHSLAARGEGCQHPHRRRQ
jgi:ABC-type Zn uptake system ZnuABC Zn-binding protein ZnuA